MKLGLLTDIHEEVDLLQAALDRLRDEQVDQVIFLGDLFEFGCQIQDACRLLADAGVIGVWGNHDFGLCFEPTDKSREKYGDDVIEFMTSLQPRLEYEGCYFAHVEPWLDPEELSDLWYFDGIPDRQDKRDRIFNAVPNDVMFAGHFHRWLLVTPNQIMDWNGETPITLQDDRYFVVIGALCEGRFAIFDTESFELTPFNLPF
ncbi:metallophosphoesterase family protein [Thalassoroseus pseudoceratinae]|uniref:metallophosphoesterase family protein n=1 Tax=Thalassoroseus pseudoceratinae TaxID=2713176 RepID=UPI00141F57C3|nr:metallophosphoesterase family protein [Thalassoroseus pseudoceratinae]